MSNANCCVGRSCHSARIGWIELSCWRRGRVDDTVVLFFCRPGRASLLCMREQTSGALAVRPLLQIAAALASLALALACVASCLYAREANAPGESGNLPFVLGLGLGGWSFIVWVLGIVVRSQHRTTGQQRNLWWWALVSVGLWALSFLILPWFGAATVGA